MGLLNYDDPYGEEPLPRTPVPLPAPTPPPAGGGDVSTGQEPRPMPTPPGGEEPEGGRRRGGGGGGPEWYPGMGGPAINVPGAPVFRPPEFSRPSIDDAYREPGYQFRVQAGTGALERSAAARGVLRTGGTLKDLVEYGQNFAAQEYGQVFNRALSAYDRTYQAARDAFAPEMARYQARVNAEQARALAAYQRDWDAYTFARRNQGGGGGGGDDRIEAPPNPENYIPEFIPGPGPQSPGVPQGPYRPGPGKGDVQMYGRPWQEYF